MIKSVLIRKLVLYGAGFDLLGGLEEVCGDGFELEFTGFVEGAVNDLVALVPEVLGEMSHREEKTGDFLHVMAGVVGFRPGFEEAVGDIFVDLLEPTMVPVELVSEDQA